LELGEGPHVEGALSLLFVGRAVEGVGVFGREEAASFRLYGRACEVGSNVVDRGQMVGAASQEIGIEVYREQLCLVVQPTMCQLRIARMRVAAYIFSKCGRLQSRVTL
jgi:hypothetical protein